MTEAKVINDGYCDLKNRFGQRFVRKYFQQVDKLLNPNENNITEYRMNGIVTDDNLFHALADMDMKKWRIAFTFSLR